MTMFRRKQEGDDIEARVDGAIQGQVAIGRNISQHQSVRAMTADAGAEEWRRCGPCSATSGRRSPLQAPPDRRAAALERLDELGR